MFKEIYEVFDIIGGLFAFLFKLVLFVLVWCLPMGLMLALAFYLADKTGIAYQLFMGAFCLLIAVVALYYCYKIWKRPDLTREQKWALMNGREMPSSIKVKSDSEIYKDLFDEADRNLKWKRSKAECKSADYELDKSGAKYIRIK